MIRAKVKLSTVAHRGYVTFFWLIHAESNSHYEECTSFPVTQLPRNERKFIPKVLKVHINRIQLYQYSASPRNQRKLKP